jgi:carbon-monoxide dehydrogenase medium subunit
MPAVEKQLEGNVLSDELVLESAELAAQASQPISDLRASANYRKEMVKNLCRRGLISAYRQAKTLTEVDEG